MRQGGLQVDDSYRPVPSKERSLRSDINEGPRRYDEPEGEPVPSAAGAQTFILSFPYYHKVNPVFILFKSYYYREDIFSIQRRVLS